LLIDRLKETPVDERPGRLSVYEISEALGISRQAVYDIKKGKYCPSLALVHKMCETWGAKFDLGGIVIDRLTLASKERPSIAVRDTQGDLFEAIKRVDTRHLEVISTKPVGRALEITVRLTIPTQHSA
jgi:DNA-binding XRE family transcriptional regulator